MRARATSDTTVNSKEKQDERTEDIAAGAGETVVYSMWQQEERYAIVDKAGKPIEHNGLWRLYDNGAFGKMAINQARAIFISPTPLIEYGALTFRQKSFRV